MSVAFQKAALDDVASISEYIRRYSEVAARSVVRRIRAAARRLSRFPFAGRIGEAGTRELVVTRLPYIIIYRVLDASDPPFVEIVGVFHAARDRSGGEAAAEMRKRLR